MKHSIPKCRQSEDQTRAYRSEDLCKLLDESGLKKQAHGRHADIGSKKDKTELSNQDGKTLPLRRLLKHRKEELYRSETGSRGGQTGTLVEAKSSKNISSTIILFDKNEQRWIPFGVNRWKTRYIFVMILVLTTITMTGLVAWHTKPEKSHITRPSQAAFPENTRESGFKQVSRKKKMKGLAKPDLLSSRPTEAKTMTSLISIDHLSANKIIAQRKIAAVDALLSGDLENALKHYQWLCTVHPDRSVFCFVKDTIKSQIARPLQKRSAF